MILCNRTVAGSYHRITKRTNQMAKKTIAKKPVAKSKPVAKAAKGKR